MALRPDHNVEVWDVDLLGWIPGEIETESDQFVTVRAERAVYVIPTSELETRLRRRAHAGVDFVT